MRKLWFWVTWLTLLTVLAFSSPVHALQYCLRNDGTAGSKAVATDCLTVGNCMDEGDYNGETFSASDVILVCPHGGIFDLGIDIDTTSVTYQGVYDVQYGWPVFDDGIKLSGSSNIIVGLEVRPGISETGVNSFEGGRFGDTARSWQAAKETAVTGWELSSAGIFAVGIGATGGAKTPTPQLYWRNKTDAGTLALINDSSGEVRVGATTALTDEANLATGNFGITSGKSPVTGVTCEQESGSGQATNPTSLSDGQYTELQVGLDFTNTDSGDEYEFSLYENSTQVGAASLATVTVCDPASNNSDIKFFWRTEQTDGDFSGTNGTLDYSAGDDTAVLWNGATIEAAPGSPPIGTNALKQVTGCTTNTQKEARFTTNISSIWDGGSARIGFWLYVDCRDTGNNFLEIHDTGTGDVRVGIIWSDPVQTLRVAHDDGSIVNCTGTQDIDGYLDEWLWIEVEVDVTENYLRLWARQTDGTTVISCAQSGTIDDIGTPDELVLGDAQPYHTDRWSKHLIISSDPNTSLWEYRNDPAYNDCVN